MCRLSRNSGSLNLLEPYGPVQGSLYLLFVAVANENLAHHCAHTSSCHRTCSEPYKSTVLPQIQSLEYGIQYYLLSCNGILHIVFFSGFVAKILYEFITSLTHPMTQ